MVSQPVAWLGLLGAFLLIVRARRSFGVPAALAHLTVLLWAALLLAGSRLSMTGFPQRFGRDLGVPLALLAALGLIAVLKSLGPGRRPVSVFAASAAVLLSLALAGTGAAQSLRWASGPSVQMTITPAIAEAGRWLEEHNEGGNIMVSPHVNQVPSRMMLAMGDYSALQSFRVRPDPAPQGPPPDRSRGPHGRPAHRDQPDLRTVISDLEEVRRPLRYPLQEHAEQANRRLLKALRGAPGPLPARL